MMLYSFHSLWDEVITQQRKCHALTDGFAGRLNYEKLSCHQTVWTPQGNNLSDKDIKKKAHCFPWGTRCKNIFVSVENVYFKSPQNLPLQLQSFCPCTSSRFTAYSEFQSRSKRFFNCSWIGSCLLCRLVEFCLIINPTPAVLMK